DELYAFSPRGVVFTPIGNLDCPVAGAHPFSMAVSSSGDAYVLYTDRHVYKVSTQTAHCEQTSYARRPSDLGLFGMAFVPQTGQDGETLFTAGPNVVDRDEELTSLAANDLAPQTIGALHPATTNLELTGTPDGRLFALMPSFTSAGARVLEIDKQNAAVIASD